MDLETENRIAAILLKEAAELRRQADRDGVGVYLQKPNVRGRPNSRFLTATVLGVQQANRAVEVNEMWRVRQKELELNDRLKKRSKDVSGSGRNHRDVDNSARSTSKRHDDNASTSYISSKRVMENCYSRKDEGLRDEEVEEFLHSRTKRGRGSVGSRMDETGPYLPTGSDSPRRLSPTPVAKERHVILGPEKPSSLRFHDSSSDEELAEKPSSWKSHSHELSSSDEELHKHRSKKRKKVHSSSDKKSSRKHKLKEKSRVKKKKRKEERRK
ncbi:hypothetical protein SLE2022_040720 [Rubroshorea leprosula]